MKLVDSPLLDIPEFEHITVLRYQNTDADFGGLSAFIDEHGDEFKGRNLFIANSSVAGPFTSSNYPLHCTDVFSSRLKGNVGAVGTSIYFLPETSAHAGA